MKRLLMVTAIWMLLVGGVHAQVIEFGLKATPEGITEIGFVYSEYYRIPPAVVVDLERRRLPEDDISVLLFLSARARVAPEVILRWRLGGESWWLITERLRLDPVTVYYVPIPEHVRPGPPFGKAYGYFRQHHQKKGLASRLVEKQSGHLLDDDDIRNLVQLRLVSEYYGYRPEYVMERRGGGEHFGRIIRTEHEKKHGKKSLKDALKEEKRAERAEKKQKMHEDDHPGKGGRRHKEE